MATNLVKLSIFFKEFTDEVQDLKTLKNLRTLDITCLSDSTKYFPLKKDHFNIEFHDPSKISMVLKMKSFNLDMSQIFKRFNWSHFPINSLDVTVDKLKFVDSENATDIDNSEDETVIFD